MASRALAETSAGNVLSKDLSCVFGHALLESCMTGQRCGPCSEAEYEARSIGDITTDEAEQGQSFRSGPIAPFVQCAANFDGYLKQ